MPVEEGKNAPAFNLETTSGDKIALKDLAGKTVVLYFYPKDNTSGCTKEAENFRDDYSNFKTRDVVLLGISPDSRQSHQKLTEKLNLPFALVVDKTYQLKDIRSGLYLLKESALAAEERASRTITKEHIQKAIHKLEEFKIKNTADLQDDTKRILDLIKDTNSGKIGDLYKAYQQAGGTASYKTFQRKVNKLADGKFITIKKTQGGTEGNTTLIAYNTTLDQF